ncbi:MAG: DUF1292 domain-containing protein [Lachnospiraceae bacterium]|nr:DUF1292 domain-containing protein [Lachnospiraceae bacterium]
MSNQFYEELEDDEVMTVTLTMEDGTEEECIVLDIFTVEELGDQEYIALLSVPEGIEESDEEEVETEICLFRYQELENEEINLDAIEDDEEAQIVQQAFEALMEAEDDEDEEEE